MTLTVTLPGASYPITVERSSLDKVGSFFNLDRRVLIVTDDGVPKEYAEKVAKASRAPTTVTLPAGEDTKSIKGLDTLLATMLKQGFTRKDCVVAVGGGVVGDLSGFAASVYMRGIDFYNIPTTLLSEVDSSIGGKTAINFGGIKNPVGTFYQPKAVLIDPEVLATLPKRHIAAGLAECIKMALTFDAALFSRLEAITDPLDAIEEIIISSLKIKKVVVEEDEKEAGLRRVLNFGHTLGHAIESEQHAHGLFHGECVALGMLPMCAESVRARLLPLLAKLSLPTSLSFDLDKAKKALRHDKKSASDGVACIFVQTVGSYEIKTMCYEELDQLLDYFR